jgi:hypothetical protein
MPSASFFDMIDDAMSGIDSIVAGDVAQRVQPLVGRRDARGLADQAHAEFVDLAGEPLDLEIDAEPGDGLELVEGAAGVAQAAARHHRHRDAAGRDRGRQRDRDLVADPAGRVLVDLGPGDRRQVEDVARPHHGVGPGRQLTVVEPAEVDRHEHRGDLIVGETTVGDAGDEAAQLGGRQRATVALGADQLDREARHQ